MENITLWIKSQLEISKWQVKVPQQYLAYRNTGSIKEPRQKFRVSLRSKNNKKWLHG